jgi:hypothetical protein
MIKPQKLEMEENFLNTIKGIYEKATANIILMMKDSFPQRSGTTQGGSLSPLLSTLYPRF